MAKGNRRPASSCRNRNEGGSISTASNMKPAQLEGGLERATHGRRWETEEKYHFICGARVEMIKLPKLGLGSDAYCSPSIEDIQHSEPTPVKATAHLNVYVQHPQLNDNVLPCIRNVINAEYEG
ncbi:hypothetical protein LshimejAT787_1005290 [Lyophyllum shimeji]|uniref:Uncharacterized protein n=1 Tax=Lyophyllum shimeji TaxID=47721 RepID=A0A9P3PUS2_LYOSH|nr:hypothetical protein LshimejAT787_1005290 [Lyophyllum shimeji]